MYSIPFLIEISIDISASELSFKYFQTNFMGKTLSTTRCNVCDAEQDQSEEMIDLFVPLPITSEGKLGGAFIRVS